MKDKSHQGKNAKLKIKNAKSLFFDLLIPAESFNLRQVSGAGSRLQISVPQKHRHGQNKKRERDENHAPPERAKSSLGDFHARPGRGALRGDQNIARDDGKDKQIYRYFFHNQNAENRIFL
jgi:hypothetical protein